DEAAVAADAVRTELRVAGRHESPLVDADVIDQAVERRQRRRAGLRVDDRRRRLGDQREECRETEDTEGGPTERAHASSLEKIGLPKLSEQFARRIAAT